MILVVTSQHPEWGESNITENIICCCCCWWWWFLVLEKTTSSPREQKSLRQKWDKEIGVPWILHKYRTRWWFHVVLIFNPTRGNDPIWLIFFQMGWNHRLDVRRMILRRLGSHKAVAAESCFVQAPQKGHRTFIWVCLEPFLKPNNLVISA